MFEICHFFLLYEIGTDTGKLSSKCKCKYFLESIMVSVGIGGGWGCRYILNKLIGKYNPSLLSNCK